jgi:cell division protein FtsW
MSLSREDRSLVSDWWFTVDRQLFASVYLLMMTGFILSFAASPAVAVKRGLEPFYFVIRHGLLLVVGACLVFVLSLLRPQELRRFALLLLVVALALMAGAIWFGPEINGAHRWLRFWGQQIQPSELMKPAFAVVMAWLFAEAERRVDMPALPLAIAGYLLVVALLALQPDVGQALLVTLVWGSLMFLSGQPIRRLVAFAAAGLAALALAYSVMPHVQSRFDRHFKPSAGDTYQIDRARQSFEAGGWFGRGPGEGTIKSVLPDAHTDFILAVIAEEYGVLACLLLMALFAFIVFRAIWHIWGEPDGFIRNAVMALVLLFGLQAMINMGVNTGLLPAKGLTLPFVSYGGSSLIGMSVTMGLVLGLTRRRFNRLAVTEPVFAGAEVRRFGD